MSEFEPIQIVVAAFGIIMSITAVALLASPKYFAFLSSSYFIERVSKAEQNKLSQKIRLQHDKERYGIGLICIALGVGALVWALGYLEAFPFTAIAVLAFAIYAILSLRKK